MVVILFTGQKTPFIAHNGFPEKMSDSKIKKDGLDIAEKSSNFPTGKRVHFSLLSDISDQPYIPEGLVFCFRTVIFVWEWVWILQCGCWWKIEWKAGDVPNQGHQRHGNLKWFRGGNILLTYQLQLVLLESQLHLFELYEAPLEGAPPQHR